MRYQHVNVFYFILLSRNCFDRLAFTESLQVEFLLFLIAALFNEAVNCDLVDSCWNSFQNFCFLLVLKASNFVRTYLQIFVPIL